ncbi:hypothetical protein [Methyloglobulus sp.]|uniref:hypothetical protein n=1 Tax=Methyloglobulus sp. TaxID=2518622 RepID=UPI0032B71723
MNRIEKPENSGNKSIKNFIITALGSVAITLIILFSGLLPIRFEVDPTRLAETFDSTGLSSLLSRGADAKVSTKTKGDVVVAENKGHQTVNNALNQEDIALAEHQDTVTLVIPPKQQLTYRLAMERDYDLDYSWRTDGKPLYSEFRGETKDAKGDEFKNFGKITSNKAHGFFIIPFTGNFGWYWDNKTDQAITVRLNTKGVYKTLGPVVQAAKD